MLYKTEFGYESGSNILTINSLEENQINQLFNFLNENPQIDTLISRYTRKEHGIPITKEFGERMANNQTLTTLCLRRNILGSNDMNILANMLERNKTLVILDLSYNPNRTDNVIKIAKAMTNNTTLSILNMRNNIGCWNIKKEIRNAMWSIHCCLESNKQRRLAESSILKYILGATFDPGSPLFLLNKDLIQSIAMRVFGFDPVFQQMQKEIQNQFVFFENDEQKSHTLTLHALGIFKMPSIQNRFPLQPRKKDYQYDVDESSVEPMAT